MLLEACDRGDLSTVQSLLGSEDLETKNPQGFTALIVAAKQGHAGLVELLVNCGANINAVNHARQSPLFVACWNNQLETVQRLIALKANLNQADHRGWTPLIISVYQDNEEIVSALLEAGCDIEKKDCFGKQAIDRAKKTKMIEMIRSALAKQRKNSRLKSPARSARSATPGSTPKASPSEARKRSTGSIGRKNSVDLRPSTPTNRQNLSRASSERSLSIDFRKQIREKVDKRTREKVGLIEGGMFSKWNSILQGFVQNVVRETDLEQRKSWKGLLDSRGKEVYGRLKEFTFKSFEVLRQSKLPKTQKSAQGVVAGGVDELVAESISKFQYKYSNSLEKTVEALVSQQVRRFVSLAQDEIFEGIQKSFDEAFFVNGFEMGRKEVPKNVGKMESAFEKGGRGEKIKFEEKGEEDSLRKAPMVKPKAGSGKNMPQMNIASTLQEFLKFEQISKS